jgi:hypothetical protein
LRSIGNPQFVFWHPRGFLRDQKGKSSLGPIHDLASQQRVSLPPAATLQNLKITHGGASVGETVTQVAQKSGANACYPPN